MKNNSNYSIFDFFFVYLKRHGLTLLDCPFCGHQADFCTDDHGDYTGYVYISCNGCNVQTESWSYSFSRSDHVERLICYIGSAERWNKRVNKND